jgi:acyl carrier protein
MEVRDRVIELIQIILARRHRNQSAISLDSSLYRDGIGMDSLDAAEFSVELEQAFGKDPYSTGQFPKTVGDVIRFYEEPEK